MPVERSKVTQMVSAGRRKNNRLGPCLPQLHPDVLRLLWRPIGLEIFQDRPWCGSFIQLRLWSTEHTAAAVLGWEIQPQT